MSTKAKMQREEERQPFMQLIRRHCVPIQATAVDPKAKGNLKIEGGSALLWETVVGRFFVSACHVWRRMLELSKGQDGKYFIIVHDVGGMLRIINPILVDECEKFDLAVFTFDGIKEYAPQGKEFLRTLRWPVPPVSQDEMVVGCGYPGDARIFRKGQWEQMILFWASKHCSVSKTGTSLLMSAEPGRSRVSCFSRAKPGDWGLPGISGAPVFALRDSLDWIGTVRSGFGRISGPHSIQATPSGFIGADGKILKPCPKTELGECDCGKYLSPLRQSVGGILKFV